MIQHIWGAEKKLRPYATIQNAQYIRVRLVSMVSGVIMVQSGGKVRLVRRRLDKLTLLIFLKILCLLRIWCFTFKGPLPVVLIVRRYHCAHLMSLLKDRLVTQVIKFEPIKYWIIKYNYRKLILYNCFHSSNFKYWKWKEWLHNKKKSIGVIK